MMFGTIGIFISMVLLVMGVVFGLKELARYIWVIQDRA